MFGLDGDHAFAIPVALVVVGSYRMASLIKTAPFSPAITGALLYALTKAPDQYRYALLSRLQQYLSPRAIARGITTLKWLFALGLIKNVNNILSELAQNNFHLWGERRKWNMAKEIAVVTGGSAGIGAAIATELAQKGTTVIVVDIASGLPSDLEGMKNVHFYKCDLTDREAVMEFAAWVQREHGHPSILVNNAGVAYVHTIMNATPQAMDKLYKVNVICHTWTLQAFLPAMIERKKGHVVATASMASFVSPGGLVPYCGTKSAVLSLYEGLAQELRIFHGTSEIKLSTVHPTFVRTNMTKQMMKQVEGQSELLTPKDVSSAVMKQIESGRSGQILLAGSLGPLAASSRALPFWLTYALTRSNEGQTQVYDGGPERAMVA